MAALCLGSLPVPASGPSIFLVPAPAPAPGPVAELASPAPACTADCPQGPNVLITYRSSTVSLNTTCDDTQGTNCNTTDGGVVDFVTFVPPALPNLVLVSVGLRIGLYVYKATEPDVSVPLLCSNLMQQFPVVQICEADGTISLNQQPRPVPNPPTSATPNDPLYPQQYALTAPKIPDVWKGGNFGDKRVRACVIDSGE